MDEHMKFPTIRFAHFNENFVGGNQVPPLGQHVTFGFAPIIWKFPETRRIYSISFDGQVLDPGTPFANYSIDSGLLNFRFYKDGAAIGFIDDADSISVNTLGYASNYLDKSFYQGVETDSIRFFGLLANISLGNIAWSPVSLACEFSVQIGYLEESFYQQWLKNQSA